MTLSAADQHKYKAVGGWLGLGDFNAANAELKALSPEGKKFELYLGAQLTIAMGQRSRFAELTNTTHKDPTLKPNYEKMLAEYNKVIESFEAIDRAGLE